MSEKDLNKLLKDSYTKESFGGSSGLMAVREDPTRHITFTDRMGIFNMFTEISDNGSDETVETIQELCEITGKDVKDLEPLIMNIVMDTKEGTCLVQDQGRGVTIEPQEKYNGLPTVCAIFEIDNMGAKGTKAGITKKGYKNKTMGVHGAGGFVVNACSEFFTVQTRIYNEQKNCVDIYEANYIKGVPIEEDSRIHKRLKYIGEDRTIIGNGRFNTGLTVYFKPDLEVMNLYDPVTQKNTDRFYSPVQIKKRLTDILSITDEPVVINLNIDGEMTVLDSRQLFIPHGECRLGENYFEMQFEPSEEMKAKLLAERISDFQLMLRVRMDDNVDVYSKNSYVGYVNKIRVVSSPHVVLIKNLLNSEIARLCARDPELKGFNKPDSLKGLTVVPILYVSKAEWGSQVKTDYTDYRVANEMSIMLADSKELTLDGYFGPAIQYCFEQSKIWLLAEKKKEIELRKHYEEKERKKKEENMVRSMQEKLSQDLRYLNKLGEFIYTSDITQSDVVTVEGKSSGGNLTAIIELLPNIAIFTGTWGKIDNARYIDDRDMLRRKPLQEIEKEKGKLGVTVLDKMDAIYGSPFRSFIDMADNDADGDHIKLLRRFYVWKFHKHLILNGKYYEVSPQFCDYTCSVEGLTYEYQGETKILKQSGHIKTQAEYEVIRKLFPNQVSFTLFKGVGSLDASDLYRILKDKSNWTQVPPLTPEEEYQLNQIFTNSSNFKKVFTEVNYMSEDCKRKTRVKSTIYKDTNIVDEELYDLSRYSATPIFNSINRKSLEEYEEKGADLTELEDLKNQIAKLREEGVSF